MDRTGGAEGGVAAPSTERDWPNGGKGEEEQSEQGVARRREQGAFSPDQGRLFALTGSFFRINREFSAAPRSRAAAQLPGVSRLSTASDA